MVGLNFFGETGILSVLGLHLFIIDFRITHIVMHWLQLWVELILEHFYCFKRVLYDIAGKLWIEFPNLIHIYIESCTFLGMKSSHFFLDFIIAQEFLSHFLELELFCIFIHNVISVQWSLDIVRWLWWCIDLLHLILFRVKNNNYRNLSRAIIYNYIIIICLLTVYIILLK